MDRSVAAIGATSGSLSAIILRLLSEFTAVDPGHPFDCPICPELDWELPRLGDLDLFSLAVGVAVGLALGPVLDLCSLLRQSWRVWLRSQLNRLAKEAGEPLYKLA